MTEEILRIRRIRRKRFRGKHNLSYYKGKKRKPVVNVKIDVHLRQDSKQKPMQITETRHSGGSAWVYYVCPRCGSSVEREYQKYCESCGQKLAWSFLEARQYHISIKTANGGTFVK